jgi:hypothetical protein
VGVGHTADLWYSVLTNALVSGNSVTISLAGNDGIWIAQEFSGIASSPLDQAPAGTTDSAATNHTSGTTGTTAQADEVLIGLHGNAGNQAYTATGGYTQQPAGGITAFGSFQLAMQYLIVAATGTYASTCTTAAGANSNNLIATFKGSTTPPTVQTLRPDADTTTTGWTTTPLWSKIEETSADGTVITATAS